METANGSILTQAENKDNKQLSLTGISTPPFKQLEQR